jgi:hypothetical protein
MPHLDTDQAELAELQMSINQARSYLNRPYNGLDESIVRLMNKHLDTRQAHIDRVLERNSRSN